MKESIISNDPYCLYCGTNQNLHRHHIFFGTANRKKADEDGCWCYLCQKHHEHYLVGVHGKNKMLDLELKRMCQRKWQEIYNKSEEDFIKRYGRNYL